MIYETGTIKTTAGQTKITGTGTKWKDNLAGISEGSPLSYLINGTVYMNTVLSINSDTEINLTYPAPATSAGVKYQIVTVLLDSMSDGARKMLANQLYIQYFLRNMDAWMTQDGIVEIKTPTGETVNLESIKALKVLIDEKVDSSALDGYATTEGVNLALTEKQPVGNYPTAQELEAGLDGKFDKAGGKISGPTSFSSNDNFPKINLEGISGESTSIQANVTDASYMLTLVNRGKVGNTKNAVRIPNANGTAMLVGDYGWGGAGDSVSLSEPDFISKLKSSMPSQITRNDASSGNTHFQYSAIAYCRVFSVFTSISASQTGAGVKVIGGDVNSLHVYNLLTDKNTTKDSQGNLKAASPVIKIFADHIELNEESEGVELEKLGTGRYKLKGTLGMNSDASWGGYHGGLVIPNGINNLPLVWADFKVEADGDIIIETHYRKHADLPPPVVLNRLITYPEFMDENGNELDSYTPCDIPNGHWIDVRVNMPSDSLYNQKQAEAQRLAEIEAERLAKEEAERIAWEAERAEQEAVERKQYGLRENEILF